MHVRVIAAHTTNYPNPIAFERGDHVALGRRDTQYDGWVRVRTSDGNEGWAPEQFLDPISALEAVANCTYSARELNTTLDQMLVVHSEVNGWYWVETEAGDLGWVPKETVA